MEKAMKPNDLLTIYETQRDVAKALNISPPSVNRWFATGQIPLLRQYQFEKITKGKLKADE